MSELKNRKPKNGVVTTNPSAGAANADRILAKEIVPPLNHTDDNAMKIASKLSVTATDIADTGIAYFIYHSILVLLYAVVAIVRLFQYCVNKTRLRFLTLAYNPSKTPLLINEDINKLAKIPKRVSTILNLKPEEDENGGISGLLNDSSEVITWCLCSGIQEMSIYEKTGALKRNIPDLRHSIYKKLVSYFGIDEVPSIMIKIPHLNLVFYGFDDDDEEDDEQEEGIERIRGKADIEISLLSAIDGRSTIVDLTKILAELSLKKELKMNEIKIQFIDKELTELVGPEPDLLILFQPSLDLQGYPPWHVRLTEIYWEEDNDQVDYSVFYRAFKKFSTCKVNVGK